MISLLEHPRYKDRVIDTLAAAIRGVILSHLGTTVTQELVKEIRAEIKEEIVRRFPVAAKRLFDMDQPIDEAIASFVRNSKIDEAAL